LVVEGLIGKDASRAKIEIGWSHFSTSLSRAKNIVTGDAGSG